MPSARSIHKEIQGRIANRGVRCEFLRVAANAMIAGDLETAKSVLREYINGTVGFVALGSALSRSPKSIMRMLSPGGNPLARNLFDVIAYLQKADRAVLEVRAVSTSVPSKSVVSAEMPSYPLAKRAKGSTR